MGDHTDETLLDDDVEEHDFNFDNEKEEALLAETEFDFIDEPTNILDQDKIASDVAKKEEDQLDQEDDVLDIGIAEEDIVDPDAVSKPDLISLPVSFEETNKESSTLQLEITEELEEYEKEIKDDVHLSKIVENYEIAEHDVSSPVNEPIEQTNEAKDIEIEKNVKSTVISLKKGDKKSYENLPDLAKVIERVQPCGPSRMRKHSRGSQQNKKRKNIEMNKKKYENHGNEQGETIDDRNFVQNYEDEDGYGYSSDVGDSEVTQFDDPNQSFYHSGNDFMEPVQQSMEYPYETNTVRISRQQNFHNVISEFKSFSPQFTPNVHVERPILATVQITQERYQIAGDFHIIPPAHHNTINQAPNGTFPPINTFMRPPIPRFQPVQRQIFPPNSGPPPPRLMPTQPPRPPFREFHPGMRQPLPPNVPEQYQIRPRFPPQHLNGGPGPNGLLQPQPPHLQSPRPFSRPLPPPRLPPQHIPHPQHPQVFPPSHSEPFMNPHNQMQGSRPMIRQFTPPQRPFIPGPPPEPHFQRPNRPPLQPMPNMNEIRPQRPMQMPPPPGNCMANVRIPSLPHPRMEMRPPRLPEYYGPPVSLPNSMYNSNQPPPPGVPNNQQISVASYVEEPVFQPPENEMEYNQYVRTDYYSADSQKSEEQYTQITSVDYSMNNEIITNDQQFNNLKRGPSSVNHSLNTTSPKQMRYDYLDVATEEDDEMKSYVKKIEDQKKQREKFIQMKEEQRLKNQMQNFIQNNIKGILQKREQFLRENELKKKEHYGEEIESKNFPTSDSFNKNSMQRSPTKKTLHNNSNNIDLSSNNRSREPPAKHVPSMIQKNENEESSVSNEVDSSTKQLHKVVKIKYKDGTVALKSFPVSPSNKPNTTITKRLESGDNINVTIRDDNLSSSRRRMVISKQIPTPNVENETALQNEKIIVESVRKGVTQSSVPLAQRFSNLKTNIKDEEDNDGSVGVKSKNRLVISDEDESRTVLIKNIGSNTRNTVIQKMAGTCGTVTKMNWTSGGQFNQAKITFSKCEEAKKFCLNFNRRMVDLSLILVSMVLDNR